MNKILIALGTFFSLIILLFLVLPFFISMDRFREPIINYIKKHTDREGSIGNLQISLFPRIILKISDLQIYEEDPKDGHFFRVDLLELKIRFFPLLLGEIQFDEVKLYKPFLKLVLQSDGTLNLPRFITPKTIVTPSAQHVSYTEEDPPPHAPTFTSDKSLPLASFGSIF